MEKKEVLLTLARAFVSESVGIDLKVDREAIRAENPWLEAQGACFVTLTEGEYALLRGCIGSIVAHRSLFDDLKHNAVSAALHDPRFPPLTKREYPDITLEVSLLTPPEKIEYASPEALKGQVVPGKHGVILKHGNYQSTYLPQVWEQLPEFEIFFSTLCQKAGMPGHCLELHPDVYLYEVEEYKED
ncbi:MAG TPA: AmmeMemoRadiSam system protein A [Epsilonproteobacteria bacterium]|nr:AmmeMemoRadiSam system protein A [Campylobacterota bacterium]